MSADKHRSRDRRRKLIYRASHDWWGIPIYPRQYNGSLKLDYTTRRNRDFKRLVKEGHLTIIRTGRRSSRRSIIVVV